MNINQLRLICEVTDRSFNLSATAVALGTSQPSVSRQILALEHELGVDLFKRSKKRLLGLTKAGTEALRVARQMVRGADDLQQLGSEFGENAPGKLTIAASHTYARYVLPRIVQQFTAKHPSVRLTLLQGNPTQIANWITSGAADICIMPETHTAMHDVCFLPCYSHYRIVLTLPRHPLVALKKLTLEKLALHPLITYDAESGTYALMMRAFAEKKLTPNIVLQATDVDVMKTYVKCGLGVAIVPNIAYDPAEDKAFCKLDAKKLFEPNTIVLGLRKSHYLRAYVYDFVKLFAPQLRRQEIEQAVGVC